MAYIGKTPASAALTSSDISDGIISTAKIADDAATADKIANAVNSAITANTAKTGISSAQTSAITANTSKTTNATHSGEVTGSGALTIAGNVVDEANLKVSNSPTNGYNLVARSGNTGGMTWEEPAGGGKVLQVVQTVKTDTESVSGSSFTDVSGLNVAITPSASNSKILITLSMTYGTSGGASFVAGKLLRGSTVIGLATDIQGSCTAASFGMNTQEDAQTYNLNYTFLDSPSTTNETTYKIQMSPQRNGSRTFRLNRPGTTSDSNRFQGTTTLTAMEISA